MIRKGWAALPMMGILRSTVIRLSLVSTSTRREYTELESIGNVSSHWSPVTGLDSSHWLQCTKFVPNWHFL